MYEQQPHTGAVGTSPADLEYPNGTRGADITSCLSESQPSTEEICCASVASESSKNRKALQLESGATVVVQTARTR
jgi:hypothetical protein